LIYLFIYWVQIAAATLSGNRLSQTVHTHRASVHQAAKLVAVLLRVAGVTAGLAESNGSRVYDSRHLQADCQVLGSAPEHYLGDRVWATFTFLHRLPRPIAIDVASSGVCVRHAEEPIVSRLGGGDLSENHVCRLGPGAEWEVQCSRRQWTRPVLAHAGGRPIRHSSDAAYRYHYRSSLLLLGADAGRLVAVHCRAPVYDCHLSLSLSLPLSLSVIPDLQPSLHCSLSFSSSGLTV